MDKKICPKAKECKKRCITHHNVPHIHNEECDFDNCIEWTNCGFCVTYVESSPEPSMPLREQKRYSTKNPKIITICGSSRFCQIMAVCRWLLEKDEGVITLGLHLLPDWYPIHVADHLAEAEDVADKLNELHLRKIDMSDEIFVVDYNGYIGKDTQREIEYTTAKGMPIRYYSKEELGLVVDGMIDSALEVK